LQPNEEQPTNQQLQQDKDKEISLQEPHLQEPLLQHAGNIEPILPDDGKSKTEPEDSIVERAEDEIDREIEAIDRRMAQEQGAINEAPKVIDNANQTHIPVKIKRFAVDNQTADTEPIDLTTSMSQAQAQEQDEQDRRIYKPLHDSMGDNTYNPVKRRYLV
jgi:hypothetical protein